MLLEQSAALPLGHSTPNPELHPVVEGIGTALEDHRAVPADHRGLSLCGPPDEQLIRIGLAASGLRDPGDAGFGLVAVCVAIVVVSHTAAILFGRYVMKMHPGVLLGVCAGAGTATPSLQAVQEAAESKIPALGYGLPYALGNVLLIVWGTAIVLLMR